MEDLFGLAAAFGEMISEGADWIWAWFIDIVTPMFKWLMSIMGFDSLWALVQLPTDGWLLVPWKIANALFPVLPAALIYSLAWSSGILIRLFRIVFNAFGLRNI